MKRNGQSYTNSVVEGFLPMLGLYYIIRAAWWLLCCTLFISYCGYQIYRVHVPTAETIAIDQEFKRVDDIRQQKQNLRIARYHAMVREMGCENYRGGGITGSCGTIAIEQEMAMRYGRDWDNDNR